MTQQHTLFVCTSCASAHRTKTIRVSGGDRLLEPLRLPHQNGPLQADLTIALSTPGKHTYLFGLPVEDEQLEAKQP